MLHAAFALVEGEVPQVQSDGEAKHPHAAQLQVPDFGYSSSMQQYPLGE